MKIILYICIVIHIFVSVIVPPPCSCTHFSPMPNQAFGVWIIPELLSRRRPCSINTGIERQLNYDWFLSSTFIDSHFLCRNI